MDTPRLRLLNNAMSAYTLRTQALTSNIANLDTPGYERIEVSFEEQLQEARHQVPGLRHLGAVQPRVRVEDGPPVLENELMELSETQMRTQLTTRALHDHFSDIRTAITGRTG